ncbi:MAG TPA: tetratricopeptide repeat protein [Terriglobales bacterium]|nr:tetratricopeptide repeat protein [Terriglobales bacterium]
MPTRSCLSLLIVILLGVASLSAQSTSDRLQVAPPQMRQSVPPAASASEAELESQGDDFRYQKAYLDALDYYDAALAKSPGSSTVLNKRGITNLQLQRYKEARKDFEGSIKADRQFADAYNNVAVVWYEMKKYGKAIKFYRKAIALRPEAASYYSNLGAAYFSKKDFREAVLSYAKALEIDPDVLERTSRAGITAQLPSPEDRARYDYELAKLYAKMGSSDRSLEHLRKAMEEGYKSIDNVYKDAEFASLRKDPRFNQLMTEKTVAIPQ